MVSFTIRPVEELEDLPDDLPHVPRASVIDIDAARQQQETLQRRSGVAMSRKLIKARARSRACLRREVVRLRRLITRHEKTATEYEAVERYDDLWLDLENRIKLAAPTRQREGY